MILRGGERDGGLAVAQREEGGFLAVEELLDHDFAAGFAETAGEHHVERLFGFGEVERDDHAFAGGKAVGLDDDRRAARAQIVLGRRDRGEAFIGRGRDAVLPAQILGEALGAFEPGGGLARPEGLDACSFKIIDDAGAERRLRPDDDKVDMVGAAERDHGRMVGKIERHADRLARDAGIAGRAIERLGQRARRDLPGQRVFAAAGAKNEDIHMRMFIACPYLPHLG